MKDSILNVEKPCRYIGGEVGSAPAAGGTRFVLAFPDTYEVGMSHLGSQILYSVLKNAEGITPERVYAPWPDREAQLREAGEPLTTLESATPLSAVDIVGFTLQYELSYSNILNMMRLGGIPLLARERDEGYPLVVGGGPCACNPEPLADFFDAFLLGDGEEAILEIAAAHAAWKERGGSKGDLLRSLSSIEGIYIPSMFEVEYTDEGRVAVIRPLDPARPRVRRRVLKELDQATVPVEPVVPLMKTVHDRVSVEIARGCTRGCRFCQAGYIYRPVRERSPERIMQIVEETLAGTGYEEVSLLSLSTGDYGCILPLLKGLMGKLAPQRVAVSFPSLRVGTLTSEIAEEVRKVRKTGFTLAPEAGSERLRQAINKGITEEDLLSGAREVFAAGWRVIKLYFMIGLPGEDREDLLAIAELSKKVKTEGKRTGGGGEVNVSVSTFVPKAHTPFQWEPQISLEETREKHGLLRDELRKRKLNFKWHDPPVSFLEGVFARGDRRLGRVLLRAVEKGCRFDGWGDHLRLQNWMEAFREEGIDPLFYHRRRDLAETLPWDHLDSGTSKEFLIAELEKAGSLVYTPDCRHGDCTGCGVCDFSDIRVRTADTAWEAPEHPPAASRVLQGAARIRIRFTKLRSMAFVSHLEMISLFSRAVRRGGIPIRYSQGFNPHPKFSFATALSVGIESMAEYMDMEIDPGFSAQEAMDSLNRVLPDGMRVLEAAQIPMDAPSLSVIMAAARYRMTLPLSREEIGRGIEAFLALDTFPLRREKKGKVIELDLRAETRELTPLDGALEMVVGRGKPVEFATAVTGLDPEKLAGAKIEKLEVLFEN